MQVTISSNDVQPVLAKFVSLATKRQDRQSEAASKSPSPKPKSKAKANAMSKSHATSATSSESSDNSDSSDSSSDSSSSNDTTDSDDSSSSSTATVTGKLMPPEIYLMFRKYDQSLKKAIGKANKGWMLIGVVGCSTDVDTENKPPATFHEAVRRLWSISINTGSSGKFYFLRRPLANQPNFQTQLCIKVCIMDFYTKFHFVSLCIINAIFLHCTLYNFVS